MCTDLVCNFHNHYSVLNFVHVRMYLIISLGAGCLRRLCCVGVVCVPGVLFRCCLHGAGVGLWGGGGVVPVLLLRCASCNVLVLVVVLALVESLCCCCVAWALVGPFLHWLCFVVVVFVLVWVRCCWCCAGASPSVFPVLVLWCWR